MSSSSVDVTDCIEQQLLEPVFQPIVSLQTGEIIAYEALIRGPAGTPLEYADALFAMADAQGCRIRLEWYAAQLSIRAFVRKRIDKKLFVNLSALAIRRIDLHSDMVRGFLDALSFFPDRVVIELTEQTEVGSLDELSASFRLIRAAGARFALDDYGTGFATLSVWLALLPEFVKIDGAFIQGVSRSPLCFEALKLIQQFAGKAGTTLIAEGIETAQELALCQGLGIEYGQGYLLARPSAQIVETIDDVPLALMKGLARPTQLVAGDEQSTVLPFSSEGVWHEAPAVAKTDTNDAVFALFAAHPALHAIAVVEAGLPVGIISRRHFVDAYVLPFHKELFGKKPCIDFANPSPLLLERDIVLRDLAQFVASADQRFLIDGVIIVEAGRYLGLAAGEDVVAVVNEIRIDAARYANPLTLLPGNAPIDQHLRQLLRAGTSFHACYCDLNSFKPFNDEYGYWQGDEMLKLAAAILRERCDGTQDFLGHVGGDDFLIFFRSADWQLRVSTAIATFNQRAVTLYSPEHIAAGGIHGEDRYSRPCFFGFVTMAVGAVAVPGNTIHDSSTIASLASLAKREAKKSATGFFLMQASAAAF